MKLITLFILFQSSYLIGLQMASGYVPDNEFYWEYSLRADECKIKGKHYKRAHVDPVLRMSFEEFDKSVSEFVKVSNLNTTVDWMIKCKFYYLTDGQLLVSKIGTKGIDLSENQIEQLKQFLNSLSGFKPPIIKPEFTNNTCKYLDSSQVSNIKDTEKYTTTLSKDEFMKTYPVTTNGVFYLYNTKGMPLEWRLLNCNFLDTVVSMD